MNSSRDENYDYMLKLISLSATTRTTHDLGSFKLLSRYFLVGLEATTLADSYDAVSCRLSHGVRIRRCVRSSFILLKQRKTFAMMVDSMGNLRLIYTMTKFSINAERKIFF